MDARDNKYNEKPRIIRQGKPVTEETKEKLRQARLQQISNTRNAVSSGAATGAAAGSKISGERKVLVKATPKEKNRIGQKLTATPKSVSAAYERAFGKRKK